MLPHQGVIVRDDVLPPAVIILGEAAPGHVDENVGNRQGTTGACRRSTAASRTPGPGCADTAARTRRPARTPGAGRRGSPTTDSRRVFAIEPRRGRAILDGDGPRVCRRQPERRRRAPHRAHAEAEKSTSGCRSNASLTSRTHVGTGTPSSSRNAMSEERAMLTPALHAYQTPWRGSRT